jgi:hypothetical protein
MIAGFVVALVASAVEVRTLSRWLKQSVFQALETGVTKCLGPTCHASLQSLARTNDFAVQAVNGAISRVES